MLLYGNNKLLATFPFDVRPLPLKECGLITSYKITYDALYGMAGAIIQHVCVPITKEMFSIIEFAVGSPL